MIFTEDSYEYDTLIIGAGAAGLISAYYLAENENVFVADKNFAGNGRTKGQTDLMLYDGGVFSSVYLHKNIRNNEYIDKIENICRQIHEKSFARKSLCIYSDNMKKQSKIRELYARYSHTEYETTLLQCCECADKLPFYAECAVTVSNGAAAVEPCSFTRKLASFLSLNGATVSEMTSVTEIIPEKNVYHIKTNNGIELYASKIIDTRPIYPMINIFTAKTEPKNGFIYATKNINCKNHSIYADVDNRITVTVKNPILSPFTDGAFAYCEETLKKNLFFEPKIEKFTIGKNETVNTSAHIKKVNDTYLRLVSPYENGLVSALILAEKSAEYCGKQCKRKFFPV